MKKTIVLCLLFCAAMSNGCGTSANTATTTTIATTTTTMASTTTTIASTTTTSTVGETTTSTITTTSTTSTTYSSIPPAVTGFQAFAGDGQISLAWTNPTHPNFIGVKILRKTSEYPTSPTDGTLVYSGTGSSETDTGLTNGTAYYYTAYTFNATPEYSSGATAEATPYAITPGVTVGNNSAFYDYIDGSSYLVAYDGQYLGIISSNAYLSDSIMNPYGSYGSQYATNSIFNPYGTYGSVYNSYSATNPYTTTPPVIVLSTIYGDVAIAYLTKNQYLTNAIDPDLLVAYYNTK